MNKKNNSIKNQTVLKKNIGIFKSHLRLWLQKNIFKILTYKKEWAIIRYEFYLHILMFDHNKTYCKCINFVLI